MAVRILVVDDEHSLRMTIAANLELEGFDVVEAENAEVALSLIKAQDFDLVLSDVRMPGMNGVDLFRHVHDLKPELPVILMTAFALEGLVQEALREGAFTLLPKPFDIAHLVAALSSAARGPTIVIVDDVKAMADSTAAVLSEVGVRAIAVTDSKDVLDVVKTNAVDVCVVDMVMPGMSGAELIELLRRQAPQVMCIAVSGYDVEEMFRRVAKHVHTILRKPVDPPRLVEAVAKARGRAGTEPHTR
jgi:DNA-binding NtrC family response regulator